MGVSRRVKIFDFKACLEEGSAGMMHYPALQVGGAHVAWRVRQQADP